MRSNCTSNNTVFRLFSAVKNVVGYVSALTTTQENRLQGLAAASNYGTLWIFLLSFFTTLCCWWNKNYLINDFYRSRNRNKTQTNL